MELDCMAEQADLSARKLRWVELISTISSSVEHIDGDRKSVQLFPFPAKIGNEIKNSSR